MRLNLFHDGQRASLTDEHLEDILKASTTNMVPVYEKLYADKKCKVYN
jgi:hypothetical protein